MAKIFILTDDGQTIECNNAQLLGFDVHPNDGYDFFKPKATGFISFDTPLPHITVDFKGSYVITKNPNPKGVPSWLKEDVDKAYILDQQKKKPQTAAIPLEMVEGKFEKDPTGFQNGGYTTNPITWTATYAPFTVNKGGIKYPKPEDKSKEIKSFKVKEIKFTPLDKDGNPSKHMHWEQVEQEIEVVTLKAKEVTNKYEGWEVEYTDKKTLEPVKGVLKEFVTAESYAHPGCAHIDFLKLNGYDTHACHYPDLEQIVTLTKKTK